MIKLINKRHSVRKLQPVPISNKLIKQLIELAGKAPSAGGLKAYKVYRATSKEKIKRLSLIAKQDWIADASIVFVICADPGKSGGKYNERGRKLYCVQDATIFCTYLDLLLVDQGYGTCWVGAIQPDLVGNEMKVKPGVIPLNYLVVGGK